MRNRKVLMERKMLEALMTLLRRLRQKFDSHMILWRKNLISGNRRLLTPK